MKIPQDEKKLIWDIFGLYKPYKKRIFIIITCILISSCISMIIPQISKDLMDKGFIPGNIQVVIKLSALTLLLVLTDQAIGMLETSNQAYLNTIIPYNLSKKAFKHTMNLKIQYFSNVGETELMNNINTDVANISKITDQNTFFIITSVFKVFGGLTGLLLIDYKLTLLVVIMLPFRYFIVRYLAKVRKKGVENFIQANEDYSAWYGDTLGGVKEIKLWGLKRAKCGQFIKKQRNIIKLSIKLSLINKANMFSESVMFQLIISILYITGAYMISSKSFTVGGMFAFVTYSASVMAPISAILNIGYSFSDILPSAKRLFGFLNMEGEQIGGEKVRDPEDIQGSIKFKNVSFSYKQKEHALNGISFEIKPREKVAIIGTNGSGKSTLINILLRFYQPDEGEIFIDNERIDKYDLENYRSLIAVVSQDFYLFNTSVEENMFFTARELERSRLNEFIHKLPEGYKSKVGKNGSMLSGGQKQKIALLRAFAKNARVLIMDEATSFLDSESEEQTNSFLLDKCRDKTIIFVTHRYDILKRMDRIVFLDEGRINDSGTHEELILRNELYRKTMANKVHEGFQEAVV